jgi:hypothetical protein
MIRKRSGPPAHKHRFKDGEESKSKRKRGEKEARRWWRDTKKG